MKRFLLATIPVAVLGAWAVVGFPAGPAASVAQGRPAASQPMDHPPAASTPVPPHDRRAHTLYTCSMHPQILQDEPGVCSVCGMDLVPKEVEAPADSSKAEPKGERKILYWVAPMDPSYRRDGPGKSPMGMDLVPVYEGGGGGPTVTIDPVVVQNMGVRIARVNRGPLTRSIRTIGTVRVAEDRQGVVNLRFSGWIERLRVRETGAFVKQGQALFDVYSPELVSAQQEYLIAVRTSGKGSSLAKSARRRVELFGVPGSVLRDVEKKGPRGRITVRAPRAGHIVHMNVVDGARVTAGKDLYRIADLAEVWVEAEVYEHDSPWLELGASATVALSFQAGEPRAAKVDYIYPTLNPRTRTVRVRLVLANPDLGLKPGAFATVEIEAQRRTGALLVPTEAILHSGVRRLVFVALEKGHFEPREIQTGLVGSKYVTEVTSGLVEGERVVTSGQFLIDSESQLQEAVQKMLRDRLAASKAFAPMEAGAKPDDEPEGPASFWTCSMHPQVVQDGPGTCPVCGMDLVEKAR